MRLLNCPKQEALLEYISIRNELSFWETLPIRIHSKTCSSCKKSIHDIEERLHRYFTPEPEITPSLISIYSKLKADETLILKGWKLGNIAPPRRPIHAHAFAGGWLFRGGIIAGIAILVCLVTLGQFRETIPTSRPQFISQQVNLPVAQIRIEGKNRVQIHYLRPQLLHSVEFETTNTR